jgi:putative lipoic acid-binding regulatory protein
MNDTRESAIKFPCDFPIKVMGKSAHDFDTLVVQIVRRHVADLIEDAISVRASTGGNYVALTVTVRAHSQQQLDALYTELSGHERVVMVL